MCLDAFSSNYWYIYMSTFHITNQGNYLPFLLDIFIYLIIVVLLLTSHGKVACVVHSKQTQVAILNIQGLSEDEKMVKKIDKATVMMLIMVGVYLLLWFPLILTSVMLLVANELSHVYGGLGLYL